jgi:hypothetical protein
MSDVVVKKGDEWEVAASNDPLFLIKVPKQEPGEPVYYMVLAHWEYDKEKASEECVEACKDIAAIFDRQPHINAEARVIPLSVADDIAMRLRPCTTKP